MSFYKDSVVIITAVSGARVDNGAARPASAARYDTPQFSMWPVVSRCPTRDHQSSWNCALPFKV
jgi:hypothetical protein